MSRYDLRFDEVDRIGQPSGACRPMNIEPKYVCPSHYVTPTLAGGAQCAAAPARMHDAVSGSDIAGACQTNPVSISRDQLNIADLAAGALGARPIPEITLHA